MSSVYRVILFILVLMVGSYFQTSLIQGHALDEDYAAYLKEAQNIANHRPVSDLGVNYYFDPNREFYFQGPAAYPLLLPMLYAVPVTIFGVDIELLKELRLALLVAGLLVLSYAMLKWGFTILEIGASLLVFGLATPIHGSVNSLGSDLPFLFFVIIALIAIDKATRAPSRTAPVWGAVMGVAIYLATELRTPGIVLLPTMWLVDVIRHRQILRVEVITGALAFCGAFALQYALLGGTESYGDFLRNAHARFFTPIDTLQDFYWSLANTWHDADQRILLLLVAIAGLAGVGAVYEALRGTTAAVFIVGYTVLLLILPDFHGGTRYLIPHLLFLGAFACRGAFVIASIAEKRFALLPTYATLGTAVAAVLLFSLSDRAHPAGLKTIGTAMSTVQEAFAFVEATAPASLIATSKYRTFHLFTNRRTIMLLGAQAPEEVSGWLQKEKVDYVVLKYTPVSPEIAYSDCPRSPICEPDRLGLDIQEIWHNADFRILQLRK